MYHTLLLNVQPVLVDTISTTMTERSPCKTLMNLQPAHFLTPLDWSTAPFPGRDPSLYLPLLATKQPPHRPKQFRQISKSRHPPQKHREPPERPTPQQINQLNPFQKRSQETSSTAQEPLSGSLEVLVRGIGMGRSFTIDDVY